MPARTLQRTQLLPRRGHLSRGPPPGVHSLPLWPRQCGPWKHTQRDRRKGHPIKKDTALEHRTEAGGAVAAPQLSASDLCFTRRQYLSLE